MIAGDQAKSSGTSPPSPKGGNGRDERGRFAQGWKGGPGNPLAKRVAELRAALLAAVTPEDIDAIARVLVQKAKGGDVVAVKELLDRCIGKAPAPVVLDLDHHEERKMQLAEDRQADARWGKN